MWKIDFMVRTVILKFPNFLDERPKSAIIFAVASYFTFFGCLILVTSTFANQANILAFCILSLFAAWSVWIGVPIVHYMIKKFKVISTNSRPNC